MQDWNVVATIHDHEYRRACEILRQFGVLDGTDFYNVVLLRVDDPADFLARLGQLAENTPGVANHISRVMPCMATFSFGDEAEFQEKSGNLALTWAPRLAGKTFYVRMHRRGMKSEMSSQVEERFLDGVLLAALEEAGTPGSITFEDPDIIIDVETIDNQAGMSMWTRADLARCPLLRLD